jgi:mitochondrial fission protein ELM1
MIANDHTPITDQVDQAVNTPTLIGGACDCGVAVIAGKRVSQPQQQIVSIIQPAVPVQYFDPVVVLALAINRSELSCTRKHLRFLR